MPPLIYQNMNTAPATRDPTIQALLVDCITLLDSVFIGATTVTVSSSTAGGLAGRSRGFPNSGEDSISSFFEGGLGGGGLGFSSSSSSSTSTEGSDMNEIDIGADIAVSVVSMPAISTVSIPPATSSSSPFFFSDFAILRFCFVSVPRRTLFLCRICASAVDVEEMRRANAAGTMMVGLNVFMML